MSDRRDPLRVEYGAGGDGPRVVRQPPPPGAASFAATYVVPGGWAFDPTHREGVARVVSESMISAAGAWDRMELARRLDRAGATLSSQASPESAEVTIWGPASEWGPLTQLLAEVVRRPRFAADDIGRVVRQIRERQLREITQPGSRADRELLRRIYPGGHPYGVSGLGTARSIARLTRADLVKFHRERYLDAAGLFVATGPESLEAVERRAAQLFGKATGSEAPWPFSGAPAGRSGGVHRVPMAGRSQVEVRLGGPSIPRSDPRYPAAFLANEVLGGRPLLGRLFQRVRERSGLAYHASSELEAMRFGGYWVAHAGTGADRWRRVVPMVRSEVVRVGATNVAAGELDAIRESAIGEIPLSLETTTEAHELAVDLAYHRLPADTWVGWPAVLRGISPGEVRDAARVALDPDQAVTVIAGPLGAH